MAILQEQNCLRHTDEIGQLGSDQAKTLGPTVSPLGKGIDTVGVHRLNAP